MSAKEESKVVPGSIPRWRLLVHTTLHPFPRVTDEAAAQPVFAVKHHVVPTIRADVHQEGSIDSGRRRVPVAEFASWGLTDYLLGGFKTAQKRLEQPGDCGCGHYCSHELCRQIGQQASKREIVPSPEGKRQRYGRA
jgi:hypothetical protein